MNLILTSYIRKPLEEVGAHIDHTIEHAVDAAGSRVGVEATSATTDHLSNGVKISTQLRPLDGTTVEWSGTDDLTELRVVVPWRGVAAPREQRTLAASRFAAVLTHELQAA